MDEPVVNRYGEPASHDDCISGGGSDCSGVMVYNENINTGRSFLRCSSHAEKALAEQERIHREYLNDTVHDEGY